ncbi:GTPase domain-containing protein [Asanoa sp. NPDC049573]|uniref:GTPase domain-containing protein n=1 Tax=Asanoa sp. NPDC049573 TaxID=3155396 RepID=UPI003424ACDB
MDLIALALVAVAVMAVVVLVRRGRRPSKPAAAPPRGDDGVPTFRVVTLGPRGSGKTLLLASMYHQMQTWGGRGYFLAAPREQVALLNHWFTEVEDPGRDWPAGTATADTREFAFDVRTRGGSGGLHTVLKLVYLDYAGALLTQPPEPGSTLWKDLDDRIEAADALVAVIDGHRVRQWIDGKREGRMGLQHALTAMISRMLVVEKPVTFVITKWDLLRDIDVDEDSRLRTVRKLLMSNQGFRDLVQEHSGRRVVRLVPVSAVGPAFAELDESGAMTKLPDGLLEPTNVDVPIAAVVPDVFEQIMLRLDQAKLAAEFDRLRRQTRRPPGEAFADLGATLIRSTNRVIGALNPIYSSLVGLAAADLIRRQEQTAAAHEANVSRLLDDAESHIEEFQLAQRKVIREFRSRVDVLEGRLSSSRLGGTP